MVANKGHKFSKIGRFFVKYGGLYAFMAPFLIAFVTFNIIPVLISIILGFTNFDVIQSPVFIGFNNYSQLFLEDPLFPLALKNTVVIASVTGPVSFLLSLMVAWMLNEVSNVFRSVITLLFYTPVISGGAYMIWTTIYSGDSYGFLNGVLMNLGIIYKPIQWTTDSAYMMGSAIIVLLWMSFGTGFLSFIAGFKNIDVKLYEAGAIDGIKNRYQEMWYITLPSMKSQLMFGAVMSITQAFGVGEVINHIYGFPSTNYSLYTMVHMLQDYGNVRFEMGYASAVATILFVIMVGLNEIIQKLLQKVGN